MAIAYRAASTPVTNASRTNITISAPAGSVSGSDVLVAFIDIGNSTSVTTSAPSGWTLLSSMQYTAPDPWAVNLYMFVRVHDGSASYTFTHAAAASEGVIVAYSGVDNTTPSDCTPATAIGPSLPTAGSLASITTVTAGALSVAARGSWDGNAITPPAGWTERLDQPVLWVGEIARPTAGVTGATTIATGNGSTNPWGSVHAALRPSSGGTSVTVTAVRAQASAAALPPVPTGSGLNATVTAVRATASATAGVPIPSGTRSVTVTAVRAIATAAVEAPAAEGETAVSGGGPATATAAMLPPTATATRSATVAAVPAAASAALLPPIPTAGGSATVVAVVATASAAALPPAVSGQREATVTAVAATASAAALPPVPLTTGSATVVAVVATASAAALPPAPSGQRNVTVTAATATASAVMLAPAPLTSGSVTVQAVAAGAYAAALAPIVQAVRSVTVTAVRATASATFRAPTVDDGSVPDPVVSRRVSATLRDETYRVRIR